MARAIWKGAISFGLVHIPVALVSATSSDNVDFDWLDKRSMEPVGYKRVNKVTGKEVTKENIVKGIQYEKGQYILLSEEEIRSAHPKSTQTIDIFSFIDSTEIPLAHIDTPYNLAPDKRGEKVYALLRETLSSSRKVGLANVILHTRQHLAAVMAIESALVLVLLRWPAEVRDLTKTLELNEATTDAALNKSEKEMAKRLVEDMSGKWEPEEYRDTFQEKIMALVDKKVNEGKIEAVETEVGEERKSADIIDLTELLKRSLGGGGKAASSRKKNDAEDADENENDDSEDNDSKTTSRATKSTAKTAAKPTSIKSKTTGKASAEKSAKPTATKKAAKAESPKSAPTKKASSK